MIARTMVVVDPFHVSDVVVVVDGPFGALDARRTRSSGAVDLWKTNYGRSAKEY